jgi:hypothetical protein
MLFLYNYGTVNTPGVLIRGGFMLKLLSSNILRAYLMPNAQTKSFPVIAGQGKK